ncbi:MAG: thioredoxin family protein [Planctomycetes bacterium]|nr:thioredoxin family protein [Planctomycetota bacterium]
MFTKRVEGIGRSALGGLLLGVGWCASCGASEAPAARTPAESATHAPAPANAPKPAPTQASASASAADQRPAQKSAKPAAPKAAPANTAVVKGPQIPLGELLTQRSLWPAKVALTEPMTIARGVTLPIGHELAVYEFNGADIALDTGTDIFECDVGKTDALERAYATKAALTPEQLAIDENVLPSRSELWPLRVKLTRRLQFQNGKVLPAGREVALRTVTSGWVDLFDTELDDHFTAEAFETDVIARARERLALPEAERTPHFLRAIAAALDPLEGADAARLEKADYVLVYRVRTGCTRCAAFEPELAKTYARLKAEYPHFEAVFLSDDKSAADARTLFAKEHLPGRAVAFERKLEAADLATRLTGELLPLVYVIHKSGTIVAQNSGSGGSPSANDMLAALEAKLKEPR